MIGKDRVRLSLTNDHEFALTECSENWSIHREAPEFVEQSTEQEILVTGIKAGSPCIGLQAANLQHLNSCKTGV